MLCLFQSYSSCLFNISVSKYGINICSRVKFLNLYPEVSLVVFCLLHNWTLDQFFFFFFFFFLFHRTSDMYTYLEGVSSYRNSDKFFSVLQSRHLILKMYIYCSAIYCLQCILFLEVCSVSRGWNLMILEVSSNPSYSMILWLWFSDTLISLWSQEE